MRRRLCKAASGAGGKDVVHMVNAALVPGIRKMKAPADAPEFKREVKEIHSVPCKAHSSTFVLDCLALSNVQASVGSSLQSSQQRAGIILGVFGAAAV